MVIKTFKDIVDRQKSIEKLEEMREYIEKRIQRLQEQKEKEQFSGSKAGREVLKIRPAGKITYQLEKVNCGKPNCEKCPHGPYWYGYRRVNGKLVSFYIGKELKDEVRGA